jgi:hypothetical protein
MAIEIPDYEVVEKVEGLEIRKYEPHNVARTLVQGSFSRVGNRGFGRLAGYIFGGNDGKQQIAMTAPVVQVPVAETSTRTSDYWLTFTMPSEHDFDALPSPDDDRVELVRVPEQYVAVLSYTGSWSESRYREHEAKLLATLQDNKQWIRQGETTWARYNHPMTLWFLRKNEVAVVVVPRIQSISSAN